MHNIQQIINNIDVDSEILEFAKELEEEYLKYVELLETYDKKFVKKFLDTYKKKENVASLEMEGSTNLESLFVQELSKKHTSMDYIINILKNNDKISEHDFKRMHGILMENDPRDYIKKGEYRDKQTTVGYFDEGTPVIQYIPPAPEDISGLMMEVLNHCNSNDAQENINHPFLKPAIIHALILHVQPFEDGNSRMGRLLHHANLWIEGNKKWNINLYQPIMYFSSNYHFNRGGYRGKIIKIDKNISSSDAWNTWFNYNLMIMNEVFNDIMGSVQKLNIIYSKHEKNSGKNI